MNSSNTPSNTSSNANAISASGIVVPVHYARLSLTSIGKVAEVKVGDVMKAGDVVVRLDAPDLQFTVNAAEAALSSAQLDGELQRYGRVKERRNGKTL